MSHNRLLGVLGAIGGALIGSALIIILGMLGYVSGWAAVAMALLAINGYKWLAKGIDKAGIVLSIVITALMVIVANFLYRESPHWIWAVSRSRSSAALRTRPARCKYFGADSWRERLRIFCSG